MVTATIFHNSRRRKINIRKIKTTKLMDSIVYNVYDYFCRYFPVRRHLVIESRRAPACQQVYHMSGLIHSFPPKGRESRKTAAKRDTSQMRRERASADLLKSVTMLTANERLILERSATSWSLRADLLERVEGSARERLRSSPSTDVKDRYGKSKPPGEGYVA